MPLSAGFAQIAEIMQSRWAAAHGVRAPANCARRRRSPRTVSQAFNADLHQDADRLGRDARRRQSGGAQQRLSEDQSARRADASMPSAIRCRPPRTHRRASSSPAAASRVEGKANYRDHTVAPRRHQPGRHALAKASFVLDEMERPACARSARPGGTPPRYNFTPCTTSIPCLEGELGRRGVLRNGLTWHFDRPPVVGARFRDGLPARHRSSACDAQVAYASKARVGA